MKIKVIYEKKSNIILERIEQVDLTFNNYEQIKSLEIDGLTEYFQLREVLIHGSKMGNKPQVIVYYELV